MSAYEVWSSFRQEDWKPLETCWNSLTEELTAVAKCFLGAKVIKSLNKKENSKMFKPQEFLCKL